MSDNDNILSGAEMHRVYDVYDVAAAERGMRRLWSVEADEQPLPTPGTADVTPYAQARIAEMLAARQARGIATYGTTLQAHNGRDALRDAMEECADLWQYLCQMEMERQGEQAADGEALDLDAIISRGAALAECLYCGQRLSYEDEWQAFTSDIPALIWEVRSLRAERDAAQALVRELEADAALGALVRRAVETHRTVEIARSQTGYHDVLLNDHIDVHGKRHAIHGGGRKLDDALRAALGEEATDAH